MLRRILVGLFVAVCLSGCSTQQAQRNESGAVAASELVHVDGMQQAAEFNEFPIKAKIAQVGHDDEGRWIFEVSVLAGKPLGSVPSLEILTEGDTALDGSERMFRLEEFAEKGTATRRIVVKSDSPRFDAVVRLLGEGYGFEVRESYPHREVEVVQDARQPLPHPVDNHGIRINSAVEVKP